MTSYFTLQQAAERYEAYRPKVHTVVADWLSEAGFSQTFDNVLDIACGTGDSTVPLLNIGHRVLGIDQSDAMLSKARAKGLRVEQAGYQEAAEYGRFDLITTCMAFHWFDFDKARIAYGEASSPGALWLIYNFAFAGSKESTEFNQWFTDDFLRRFPSPPRNSQVADFTQVADVRAVASDKGYIPFRLSRTQLIGYLTTLSNIEAAVQNGRNYEDIESELAEALSRLSFDCDFHYQYSYDLYQYQP